MIKVCGAWPGALGSRGKVAVIIALNNRPHNPISFGPAGESGSNHGSKSFGLAIITLILGEALNHNHSATSINGGLIARG